MKIDHIALWVDDLEKMRNFYLQYFDTASGELYINPAKKFSSYFISFYGGGSRIELMNRQDIVKINATPGLTIGLTHLAVTAGNSTIVNEMVELFRKDGYKIIGEPRISGDGYYEAVILDPENNVVELMAEFSLTGSYLPLYVVG
jgi:lactoylglutathione lyase